MDSPGPMPASNETVVTTERRIEKPWDKTVLEMSRAFAKRLQESKRPQNPCPEIIIRDGDLVRGRALRQRQAEQYQEVLAALVQAAKDVIDFPQAELIFRSRAQEIFDAINARAEKDAWLLSPRALEMDMNSLASSVRNGHRETIDNTLSDKTGSAEDSPIHSLQWEAAYGCAMHAEELFSSGPLPQHQRRRLAAQFLYNANNPSATGERGTKKVIADIFQINNEDERILRCISEGKSVVSAVKTAASAKMAKR